MNGKKRTRRAWQIYGACLLAFTIFISLDTFVLQSAYQTNATEMNTSMFAALAEEGYDESSAALAQEGEDVEVSAASQNAEQSGSAQSPSLQSASSNASAQSKASEAATSESATLSASSPQNADYSDGNISITMSEYVVSDTTVYVADVQLSSAEYLKTAFANDTYGRNVTETTSSMAEDNGAVLAVNGDYYGAQESGYVIRNGVVYRDKAGSNEVLCIYADGSMEVVDPSEYTAQELADRGVWQAFSFGPGLVEGGEVAVGASDEVGRAKASNPRTAIGMISPLHYVFVVSDGRTDESEGLSLYELAQFMQSLGAETAYNLDGGGSSTMVFMGQLINNPTGSGNRIKERAVSDIVYIG